MKTLFATAVGICLATPQFSKAEVFTSPQRAPAVFGALSHLLNRGGPSGPSDSETLAGIPSQAQSVAQKIAIRFPGHLYKFAATLKVFNTSQLAYANASLESIASQSAVTPLHFDSGLRVIAMMTNPYQIKALTALQMVGITDGETYLTCLNVESEGQLNTLLSAIRLSRNGRPSANEIRAAIRFSAPGSFGGRAPQPNTNQTSGADPTLPQQRPAPDVTQVAPESHGLTPPRPVTGNTQTSASGSAPAPAQTAAGPHNDKELPNVIVKDAEGRDRRASEIVSEFATDILSPQFGAQEAYSEDVDLAEVENDILRNLLKVEGGSVKLLGPAGGGKSTLIRRLAARLREGKVPGNLKEYRFFMLSASAMQAGTRYVGSIESRIGAMVALSRAAKIVWIIDEAHVLSGAGTHSKNSNNIFQTLKPEMATGAFKMIGISTPDEWSAAYSQDTALDRRFERVNLPEPQGEKLTRILISWMKKYEIPETSPEILKKIIRVSNELAIDGAQPSKSTSLISEIHSEKSLRGDTSPINDEDIKLACKRKYGVDPAELEPEQRRRRLEKLVDELDQLAGQKEAKSEIIKAARRILTGVHDRKKPRYRLLFTGPKGQGKTEIVKIFAEAMNLPADNRIVMSNYSSPHQIDALKSQIATFVSRNPFTVLFFDEVEKAHPQMQQALLGILDAGEMSYQYKNGDTTIHRTISLRNTSVFFATNAGQDYILSHVNNWDQFDRRDLKAQMLKEGIDEFLFDRLDGVVPFKPLSFQEFQEVIEIHLKKTIKELQENTEVPIRIENPSEMAKDIAADLFSPAPSGRDVLRSVKENVRDTVADYRFDTAADHPILLKWNQGHLSAQEDLGRASTGHPRCEGLFIQH